MTQLPAQSLLTLWILQEVSPEANKWLQLSLRKISGGVPDRVFAMLFSAASRYLDKKKLGVNTEIAKDWQSQYPTIQAQHWSHLEASRILFLISRKGPIGEKSPATFIDSLYQTADMNESVAIQKALPLLSHPEDHLWRAGEALRSSITEVFLAVIHNNPYPSEFLPRDTWNHFVLKTLFVEASLTPIVGLKQRGNRTLAVMLLQYVHERRAASRRMNPQLWQCIAPYIQESEVEMIIPLLSGTENEKKAGVLALHECTHPRAKEILKTLDNSYPNPTTLSWEHVHHEL